MPYSPSLFKPKYLSNKTEKMIKELGEKINEIEKSVNIVDLYLSANGPIEFMLKLKENLKTQQKELEKEVNHLIITGVTPFDKDLADIMIGYL